MFFSLLQTLICVLLVNSGLYALHLTGSNTPGSIGSNGNNGPSHSPSQLNKPSTNPFQTSSNRLNEELADLAQLERERLMVMGLVKQTAEESGYHGRPIITGRIKMHPAEDMESEYSAWLSQQARNVMFGNVVKQPLNDEEDYDSDGDSGGGGGGKDALADALRSSHKYDYGRIVQPVEREFENPHNLDLDDFMELEPVQEEEDIFPDMDGYAYIEELMAEENKERLQHHYQPQQHPQIPQFPGLRQQHSLGTQTQHHMPLTHSYQNHEPLDSGRHALEDFFEKEQKLQHQQQQQQQQHQQQQLQQDNQFNAKYRNNIRMQQKWLRKRNQMQQQQQPQQLLPRNIFGQKNAKQHHFNSLSSNKLAMTNSEATATTRIKNNKQTQTAQQQQQQEQEQQQQSINDKELNKEDKQKISTTSSQQQQAPLTKSNKSIKTQELKPELLQHPNHKRSGLTPASLASAAGISSPHSLASQLMLRTARGQRQYDVPQIECPTAMDGMERFACPTPDVQGRYRCIDDHVLCDGFIDCPEGEDEDRRSCMFYKTTKAHLDVLADALLRWARGR